MKVNKVPVISILSKKNLDNNEKETPINNDKVNEEKSGTEKNRHALVYGVTENPPWFSIPPLALQQAVTVVSGTVSLVFVVKSKLCADGDNLFLSELISTALVMAGICTLMEVLFGVRLSIVQGGAAAYMPPILAMMSLPKWQCPINTNNGTAIHVNASSKGYTAEALWGPRLRELNGGLILASLVHMSLGATGVMGFLMRYIGPLTIAPTVSLIGLGLIQSTIQKAEHSWAVALVTVGLLILFSVYLVNVPLCCPTYRKAKGCGITRIYLFRMFPVLLGLGGGWLVSHIMTISGSFTSDPNKVGYMARSDARTEVINRAQWVFLPYPGQWGAPTFSLAAFLGMSTAAISSVVESCGDYSAVASICGLPRPPTHAINRGIAVEGFGSIISGLFGVGHATTSYSSSIGFIGVTKIGSRIVAVAAGIILLIAGIIGKVGAFLASVPDPVIGGFLCVGLSLVVSIGLSNIKTVNMQSSRNVVILGFCIFMGLLLPTWIKANPGAIKTGVKVLDQVITVFLSTSMFLGGVLGFILDNTIPGTREDRGFVSELSADEYEAEEKQMAAEDLDRNNVERIYRLPFIMRCFESIKCCKYNPTSPTFEPENIQCPACCYCCKKDKKINAIDNVNQSYTVTDEVHGSFTKL